MRLAMRFAYDGMRFRGYARQPGLRTVEGDILDALAEIGAVADPRIGRFRTASRTDKGVSAAANVLALDTDFDVDRLLGALNALLDGIVLHGVAPVPEDFNPRHEARRRWYRYILHATDVRSADALARNARIFEGEHDFRHFCKADAADKNAVLAVDSVAVSGHGEFLFLDITAHRFLWQMVRRIVAALLAADSGTLDPDSIGGMLDGGGGWPGLEPAPARNLILMDVDCGMEFSSPGDGRHLGRYFETERDSALLRTRVMDMLAACISGRPPG